jgi:hypothetical protein
MRIDWLVPARYAELSSDGTMTIVGGGVDTLLVSVSKLPTRLGVFLAMRVAGNAASWRDTEHVVSIVVAGSDAQPHAVLSERLRIPEAAAMDDQSRDIGVLLPAPCRWQVPRPDRYAFTVSLDGQECRQLSVTVVGK